MKPDSLIQFLADAEKLKSVLRHSYTSMGKQESVAEHCWMLTLIALAVVPNLDVDVDLLTVLEMLIVHDLPEIITGDVPAFDKTGNHHAAEREALVRLLAPLTEPTRSHLLEIWEAYEARETLEARIAYAIDKLEALLQHNLADISTWDENDFSYQIAFEHPKHQAIAINDVLRELKRAIDQDSIQKINEA